MISLRRPAAALAAVAAMMTLSAVTTLPATAAPSLQLQAQAAAPTSLLGGGCEPGTGVTVVVNFSPTNSDLVARCAIGEQASYKTALTATGFSLETYSFGFGDALCAIDGVGSNQTECSTFSGAYSWVNWINVEGGATGGAFTTEWQSAITGIDGGRLAVDTVIGFSQTTGADWPGAGPQVDLTAIPGENTPVDPPAYGAADGNAALAAGWIGRQVQAGDGLLSGSVGFTTDAIYALAAAGVGKDVIDQAAQRIWTSGTTYIGAPEARDTKTGAIAKTALALQIAGLDPTAYPAGEGTRDLIADLRASLSENGTFGTSANPYPFAQALPVLALARTVAGVPTSAVNWLISQQCADTGSPEFGSFYGYYFDGAPPICESGDSDSTAMTIQALIAAGVDPSDPVITAAQNWLLTAQAADGSLAANTNSTGLAGQVYAELGNTAAASAASGYIGSLQFSCATVNAEASAITPEDVGAVSYDAPGFTDAAAFGIDETNLGTIQYATVQAVFGLGTPAFGDLTAEGAQAALPAVPDCTPVAPSFVLTVGSGTAGDVIPFSGSGFAPGEQVSLTLNSTPIDLGVVTADPAGTITGSFTVPAAAVAGAHTVVVAGLTSAVTVSAAFTVLGAAPTAPTVPNAAPTQATSVPSYVTKPGDLAATGASSATVPMLAAAVLLMLVGSALVLTARRRSEQN